MVNPSSDSYRNPLRYQGQDYSFAPIYRRDRDPRTPTDASPDIKPKEQQGYYPISSFWSNSTNGNLWALANIYYDSVTRETVAKWVLLGSTDDNPVLSFNVPNGVTSIDPDNLGAVTLTSTGGSVVITGSSAAPNNTNINFDVAGPFFPFSYVQINAASSPYTALSTDYYISTDSTAGTITIRLPDAPTQYRPFIIKDRTGKDSTNNVTVTTVTGAVLIDGVASYVLAGNFDSINLLFNGTSYEVY